VELPPKPEYPTALAASTLIILFSEMLNFSINVFLR
jgi:hypothetical protein